jgi:tetratricopeptide (TPR) repeat protein
MSRLRIAIVVALGGVVLLAAIVLSRRSEPVAPRKPSTPRVVRPPDPAPAREEPSHPAMADRIRSAERELLALCAKRDQLLKTKQDLEQAAKKEQAVMDKRAAADEHYRLAERYFQASDFERASTEAQKAIETHPDHLAARGLLQEIKFILRKMAGSK